MTIRLQPDLEKFIGEQVRAGKYLSADDAVAAAVEQMREREEKLAWLRREIQVGVDQIERGEGEPWDLEETKSRLAQRLREARGE